MARNRAVGRPLRLADALVVAAAAAAVVVVVVVVASHPPGLAAGRQRAPLAAHRPAAPWPGARRGASLSPSSSLVGLGLPGGHWRGRQREGSS
eukprot:2435635-Pyramimonas_sp.AAC.1